MKVNLLLNNDAVMNGYLNIDPFAQVGQEKVWGTLQNLDEHVEDAECSELRAINIIDYYPLQIHGELLLHWIKKLGHGGILTLGFIESIELAKAIANGALTFEEMNILLHGTDKGDWQTIKSSSTMDYITRVFNHQGLKIIFKRVYNYQGIMKGQRQ